MSSYQYSAEPRAVKQSPLSKTQQQNHHSTRAKYRNETEEYKQQQNASLPANIMFDARVVRGSNHSPNRRTFQVSY
jgi:hypothetical protein